MKTNKLVFFIITILILSIASAAFAFVSEDNSTSEDTSTLAAEQSAIETQEMTEDGADDETNTYVSARLVMIEKVLAQLVEDGDITQEEADKVLAGLKNHLTAAEDPIADLLYGGGRGHDFQKNMGNQMNDGNSGMPDQFRGRGKGFGMQGNSWDFRNNNGFQNPGNQPVSGTNLNPDCPCGQVNP